MDPGLYIVGTPIGNMDDITLRALQVLREVDVILAEDTRHSRKLLDRHEIQGRMISNHKFNEASRVDSIIEKIEGGAAIALISDSGMPGISDPGSRAIRAVRARGLKVEMIPGVSAVTTAAALSGWADEGFRFAGFLSNKSARRQNQLRKLEDEPVPLVLFESPHRIEKMLADIETVMGERPVFVGRELTKKFEEHLSGTAAEVKEAFANRKARGEFVVVIAPR